MKITKYQDEDGNDRYAVAGHDEDLTSDDPKDDLKQLISAGGDEDEISANAMHEKIAAEVHGSLKTGEMSLDDMAMLDPSILPDDMRDGMEEGAKRHMRENGLHHDGRFIGTARDGADDTDITHPSNPESKSKYVVSKNGDKVCLSK